MSAVLLLAILFWSVGVMALFAEEGEVAYGAQCPVLFLPQVEIDETETFDVVQNLEVEVEVNNPDNYTVPGLQLGVGFYSAADEAVLQYWVPITEVYTLEPADRVRAPINVSLSSLPAGDYQVRVVAAQGGVEALFGVLLAAGSEAAGFTITKVAEAETPVAVALSAVPTDVPSLDADAFSRPLEVAVVTTNQDEVPLLDSDMMTIIATDPVPLGTAVVEVDYDSVKLVPGSSRTSALTTWVPNGTYAVYGSLLTAGVAQPVVAKTVTVGELVQTESVPVSYLSVVAEGETEIIACVANTDTRSGLVEQVAVQLTEVKAGQAAHEVLKESRNQLDQDYFVFTKTEAVDAVTVELFRQSYQLDAPAEEYALQPAGTVTYKHSCEGVECATEVVGQAVDRVVSDFSSRPFTQTQWYYYGVTLAAALLLYLLLTRLLGRKEDREADEEALSDNELE